MRARINKQKYEELGGDSNDIEISSNGDFKLEKILMEFQGYIWTEYYLTRMS